MALDNKRQFILPLQVVGQTELNRLLLELESLESELIGSGGSNNQSAATSGPPKTTDLLNQTAISNGYNLTQNKDRRLIAEALKQIRDQAPLLHISFAAEPSPKVTQAVLAWLRGNVHRYALLHIGLQPAIAAGCVLRTPNKIFDLSLRASFERQKPYLIELIKGAVAEK